jgi:L-2-hydroxyglutarate oxidase LhgO
MDRIDTVVVGAGVVGLAVARALALAGSEVVLLEAEPTFGSVTSARNSEVIHAGIYYPPGSLKAALCLRGKALLYDFCELHGVAHRRCGKLIVATHTAQIAALHQLQAQAQVNSVHDLQWLTGDQARAIEPALVCEAALLSPSTGIVDSHALMLALLGDAQAAGADLALCSPLLQARRDADGFVLTVGGEQPVEIRVRRLINAGGLAAPDLARRIDGLDTCHVPGSFYCKGNYFSCAGMPAFSHLIYPIPEQAGLGVHVTLDLAGQMRFGPDVQWLADMDPMAPDYHVDPQRVAGMAEAIRRYWPGLPDGALSPAYSGIRPKISGPEETAADFRIDGPEVHGVDGLINLFGIESPGLTACLAIAEQVQTRLT